MRGIKGGKRGGISTRNLWGVPKQNPFTGATQSAARIKARKGNRHRGDRECCLSCLNRDIPRGRGIVVLVVRVSEREGGFWGGAGKILQETLKTGDNYSNHGRKEGNGDRQESECSTTNNH